MFDVLFLAVGLGAIALLGLYAHALNRLGGATPMFEPLLGLVVAIALGVYLVITLLKPERF